MKYYNLFTNDPLFKQREFDNLDEERKITTLRIYRILKLKILSDEELLTNPFSVSIHVLETRITSVINILMQDLFFVAHKQNYSRISLLSLGCCQIWINFCYV